MPQDEKTATANPKTTTHAQGHVAIVDQNKASGAWLVAPVQLVPAK